MGYRRSPVPLIPRANKRPPELLTKREAARKGSDSLADVADCLKCEKEECNNCKWTTAHRRKKESE